VFKKIENVYKRFFVLAKVGISFLKRLKKEISTKDGRARFRKKLNKITYYSKFILRETFSYDVENRERMTSQFLFIIFGIFGIGILWSALAELDQVGDYR
jgi:hypothetical protein